MSTDVSGHLAEQVAHPIEALAQIGHLRDLCSDCRGESLELGDQITRDRINRPIRWVGPAAVRDASAWIRRRTVRTYRPTVSAPDPTA